MPWSSPSSSRSRLGRRNAASAAPWLDAAASPPALRLPAGRSLEAPASVSALGRVADILHAIAFGRRNFQADVGRGRKMRSDMFLQVGEFLIGLPTHRTLDDPWLNYWGVPNRSISLTCSPGSDAFYMSYGSGSGHERRHAKHALISDGESRHLIPQIMFPPSMRKQRLVISESFDARLPGVRVDEVTHVKKHFR
jgi:hypothetical protein